MPRPPKGTQPRKGIHARGPTKFTAEEQEKLIRALGLMMGEPAQAVIVAATTQGYREMLQHPDNAEFFKRYQAELERLGSLWYAQAENDPVMWERLRRNAPVKAWRDDHAGMWPGFARDKDTLKHAVRSYHIETRLRETEMKVAAMQPPPITDDNQEVLYDYADEASEANGG